MQKIQPPTAKNTKAEEASSIFSPTPEHQARIRKQMIWIDLLKSNETTFFFSLNSDFRFFWWV